jgi:hypothetical protein
LEILHARGFIAAEPQSTRFFRCPVNHQIFKHFIEKRKMSEIQIFVRKQFALFCLSQINMETDVLKKFKNVSTKHHNEYYHEL